MISILPWHRDRLHQRQIFPQVIERLQSQPPDQARVKSLSCCRIQTALWMTRCV